MRDPWADPDVDSMWALAELDRVVGGEALASRPSKHAGGEWDMLLALPKRTRRKLIGARYMRPHGLQPDQLAEFIRPRVPECETTDAAMAWYVKTCLVAIGEARTLAHRRRHLRVARRNGYPTYYAYRTAVAREMGYDSLWDMRKESGWT